MAYYLFIISRNYSNYFCGALYHCIYRKGMHATLNMFDLSVNFVIIRGKIGVMFLCDGTSCGQMNYVFEKSFENQRSLLL